MSSSGTVSLLPTLRTRRRLSTLLTVLLLVLALYSWWATSSATAAGGTGPNKGAPGRLRPVATSAQPEQSTARVLGPASAGGGAAAPAPAPSEKGVKPANYDKSDTQKGTAGTPQKSKGSDDAKNQQNDSDNSDESAAAAAAPGPVPTDDQPALLEVNFAVNLTNVDLAQTRFLDFLNGELDKSGSEVFGGSLLSGYPRETMHSDFVILHAFALQHRSSPYNRTDFLHMGRRARALRIAYTLLYDKELLHAEFVTASANYFNNPHSDSLKLQKRRLAAQLKAIVDDLTQLMYPWLKNSFSSIFEMQSRFRATISANGEAPVKKYRKDTGIQMRERGILLSTGKGHFELAIHAIVSLREVLKCDLPIEVHHMGPNDLDKEMLAAFNSMPGVNTVDVYDYWGEEAKKLGGWAIKPFALLASSFKQVMFLDADAVFVQNPEVLFTNSEIFKKYGQLFYHDRTITGYDNCYNWFNGFTPYVSKYTNSLRFQKKHTVHEMESGVIVLDKTRTDVLHGLLTTAKMNSKLERDGITYKMMHGDKESYWMSWELVRSPYKFSRSFGGTVGYKDDQDAICGGLFHTDEYLQPLWWNGGVVANKHVDKGTGYIDYEYYAYDDEGENISWVWETKTTPFCLKPKTPDQKVIVGELSASDKEITKNLVQIYKDIIADGWEEFLLKQYNIKVE
ncbi:hypothetical protein HDU84_005132 [Entophlyctis sp. JEL0112]|nr:hypothetical protein HDU84_005132 [Entophlyctis sp. JEL0112]